MDDGNVMPRISKPELIVAVILLSVLLVFLGSTLVLSLFQPVREEAVHLSGNIKYTPPTRPAFFGLEHGGRSYSVNAPRFLDEQGNRFLDNHRPEKIISIEGIRFYTPLHYKATLQRLAIRRIEFLEDGKQQTVVVPPEQFSVALRYWRTESWLERLFCYSLYLIACGWLCVFYRKENRQGIRKE